MNYFDTLPADAKQVKNALAWVDRKGNLYGIETRMLKNRFSAEYSKHPHYGEYFKYRTTVNSHNGYVYGLIKYLVDADNEKYENRQRRLHIVVAETFLDNPENLPIVGHKNNIKTDNRVENLYWTTYKENTQKAVDDGLLINDKGYDDSQSQPVIMFDTYTNETIGKYGSIKEASRETGIEANTISRQAKYKKPVRKPFYFRFQDDKSASRPIIVVQYDLKTHKEIGRYFNTFEASRQTGISSTVIQTQCQNNVVPKWTKSKTYFLYK